MGGTVNIHGREYKTVALRVNEFREKYPITDGWAITATIISVDEKVVVMRSEITNPEGLIVATGYAEEERSQRGINSTSALENCETSAIGRALAAAGFAGTEYASADEVAQAVRKQDSTFKPLSMNDKFNFGKHKGKVVGAICASDEPYVLWLIDDAKKKGKEIFTKDVHDWLGGGK